MTGRVLVAGIGNIFLGDDGFGVEVAQRLSTRALPDWVRVSDFGIRGMHLAYELLDGGYDTTILVDATPRGDAPGTVYLIEPDMVGATTGRDAGGVVADAHGMTPASIFAMLDSLGGMTGHVLIVGCEPLTVEEGIGLSEPVGTAVDRAVDLIVDILGRNEVAGKPLRNAPETMDAVGSGVHHLDARSL